MSIFQHVGSVTNIARQIARGDTAFDASIVTTQNGTVGLNYTQSAIAGGIILRTGTLAGAANDVLVDAATVVNAISINDYERATAGSQFRLRVINSATTQTITLTAGAGITLSGVMTIATNTWREFLLQVIASAVPSIQTGSTTNASAQVQLVGFNGNIFLNHTNSGNLIEPGMFVTGAGVPALTTVLGITPEGLLTLSANATATASGVTLTFTPNVLVTNIGSGTI